MSYLWTTQGPLSLSASDCHYRPQNKTVLFLWQVQTSLFLWTTLIVHRPCLPVTVIITLKTRLCCSYDKFKRHYSFELHLSSIVLACQWLSSSPSKQDCAVPMTNSNLTVPLKYTCLHCSCLPVTVIITLKSRLCCSYDKFKSHCSFELHLSSIVLACQWLSSSPSKQDCAGPMTSSNLTVPLKYTRLHCSCLPVTVIITLKTRLCCSYDKFKRHCSSEIHSSCIVFACQWLSSSPSKQDCAAPMTSLNVTVPLKYTRLHCPCLPVTVIIALKRRLCCSYDKFKRHCSSELHKVHCPCLPVTVIIALKTRLCCSYDKFKPHCSSELHKVHRPCLPVTVIIALKTRLCCSYDKFKRHCSSELHSSSIVPARQWLSAPERFGFYADIVHLSILPP